MVIKTDKLGSTATRGKKGKPECRYLPTLFNIKKGKSGVRPYVEVTPPSPMNIKQMKRHVHVYYVQVMSLGPRTPNQVSRFGICDPHPHMQMQLQTRPRAIYDLCCSYFLPWTS